MENKKPNFSIRLETQRIRDLPKLLERAKEYADENLTYDDFANNFKGFKAYYKFNCKLHGDFEATGDAFVNPGRRKKILCPTCRKIDFDNTRKKILEERMKRKEANRERLRQIKASMPDSLKKPVKTREDFENRGKWIYGDQYTYEHVEYVNLETPVILVCKDHGVFKTIPHSFFKGFSGCVDCGLKKRQENQKVNIVSLCERLFQAYGDQYKVMEKTFINMETECVFICKDHGPILKKPNRFMVNPCEKCFVERNNLSFEEFVRRATEIHNGKFKYVKTSYINTKLPMTIICPIHGPFNQVPGEHIKHRFVTGPNGIRMINRGNGCRLCRESKGERFVANALNKMGVKYCREAKCGDTLMRFDFLIIGIPNIVIEYDGEQHYRDVWKQVDFEKLKERDRYKDNYCKEVGWSMYRIPYTVPYDKIELVVRAICYRSNLQRTSFISQSEYDKYSNDRLLYIKSQEEKKKTNEEKSEVLKS